MEFHVLNKEAQLLVKLLGNLTRVSSKSSRATPCEGRRVRDQHKYMEFFNITPYTTEGHVSGR